MHFNSNKVTKNKSIANVINFNKAFLNTTIKLVFTIKLQVLHESNDKKPHIYMLRYRYIYT